MSFKLFGTSISKDPFPFDLNVPFEEENPFPLDLSVPLEEENPFPLDLNVPFEEENSFTLDLNADAVETERDWASNDEKHDEKVLRVNSANTLSYQADVEVKNDSAAEMSRKGTTREVFERPKWLPENWGFEVKMRTTGRTAGVADKYFFSPSGQKLRSKKEVLHYLETGSKPKRKLKSDEGASASDTSGHKQKKSRADIKNLSGLDYDFKNPPQSVDYTLADEGKWSASVDNKILPEFVTAKWGTVFSHVPKLNSSSGGSREYRTT